MKRLLSRRSNRPQSLESLEGRRLLSGVRVASVSADNRGEVVITMAAAIDSATVNKNSVQAYTAGADKIIGTADDTRVPASVRYSPTTHRITVEAQIPVNDGYRVKLVADRLRDAAGTPIDGEFNGSGVASGNGKAGGNFEFQTKNDKSDTPTVRMSTSAGTILVSVYRAKKPLDAAAFLGYVNSGGYDGMFIDRSVTGFVLQGGQYGVTSSNTIMDNSTNDKSIANEFSTNGVIHNTAFTLAFAKQSNSPNPPGREYFFNLADNSDNLDNQNGGFTVFATANNATSTATLEAIASKVTVQISSGIPAAPVNSSYDGTLDPQNDLVVFRRCAVVDKVTALG